MTKAEKLALEQLQSRYFEAMKLQQLYAMRLNEIVDAVSLERITRAVCAPSEADKVQRLAQIVDDVKAALTLEDR